MVIKSGNQLLNLQVDKRIWKELQQCSFVYKYIPEATFLDQSYPGSSLEFIDSNTLEFEFNQGKSKLYGRFGSTITIEDLVTVIDYCLDYVRQEEGVYCIHGSAICYNHLGIILMGSVSGLGKTSLALNLCLLKGYSFIADEKILVNREGKIMGGTKMIEFNKNALRKLFSSDLENKNISDLEKILKIEKGAVDLALVVQPIIVPKGQLLIDRWDTLKSEFHFYEELSRKIRGISRRINNFSYPLQSIDDQFLALQRSADARRISQEVPFFTIRGDIGQVQEEIGRLIHPCTRC